MHRYLIMSILFVVFPASANASDYCAEVFDGFAAQEKTMGAAYAGMKSDREVCNYGRNIAIPARKKMVATVKEIQARCKLGGAELAFAQKNLEEGIQSTSKACKSAGM
jgi:hypothetical protein